MAPAAPRQGEIWLADLDPTVGDEIQKRRPVLILSRDEVNAASDPGRHVVIVAPLTSTPITGGVAAPIPAHDHAPARVSHIIPWQVRAVSRTRLRARIGSVDRETLDQVAMRVRLLISTRSA